MSEVIDNDFHPVDQGLNATEDHWRTVRSEGTARLRTQFQQSDAKNWMKASGDDAKTISTLVRGRNND